MMRRMTRKSGLEAKDATGAVEKSVISDYVRLCVDKGIKPAEAFKEMKQKLLATKALKKASDKIENNDQKES
jgi:hypothetical protein